MAVGQPPGAAAVSWRMVTVATWNVLHRIHAENWGEAVVDRHVDEAARIEAITARLCGHDEHVLALQEVSGDQLASLRRALPDATIVTLRYPRIPRPRRGPTALRDPAEYLVTIVRGEATVVLAEASRDDPGKGLLAVDVGVVRVVNTHVTFGDARVAQLARLREVARAAKNTAIVLGDFNADRDTVAAGLGDDFDVAIAHADSLPTRPRIGSDKPSSIDHVAVRGGIVEAHAVLDAGGLSDHNPVVARVRT